jgi:Domain of unknown function (DUF4333)
MRKLVVVPVAALALLLAGCGTLVIIPKGAETVIRNLVKQHTGETATNVNCPSGVHAKAGNTFNCRFSANGHKYIAHMDILRIKGTSVYYNVSTSPA